MHPERRATHDIFSPDRGPSPKGPNRPDNIFCGQPAVTTEQVSVLTSYSPLLKQPFEGPQFGSARDLQAVNLTGEAGPTRHGPCPLGPTPGHSTALHRAKTSGSPGNKSQLSHPVRLSPGEWFPHSRDDHLLEAVKVLELNIQQVLTQRLVPREGIMKMDTATGFPSGARQASQPKW